MQLRVHRPLIIRFLTSSGSRSYSDPEDTWERLFVCIGMSTRRVNGQIFRMVPVEPSDIRSWYHLNASVLSWQFITMFIVSHDPRSPLLPPRRRKQSQRMPSLTRPLCWSWMTVSGTRSIASRLLVHGSHYTLLY